MRLSRFSGQRYPCTEAQPVTWQAAPAIRRPRGNRQRAEPSGCRLLPAHGFQTYQRTEHDERVTRTRCCICACHNFRFDIATRYKESRRLPHKKAVSDIKNRHLVRCGRFCRHERLSVYRLPPASGPVRSYLGPVIHEPPDRCRFYGCGRSDPAYRHENCQTKDEIKKPPIGRLFLISGTIAPVNPSSCTFWFL